VTPARACVRDAREGTACVAPYLRGRSGGWCPRGHVCVTPARARRASRRGCAWSGGVVPARTWVSGARQGVGAARLWAGGAGEGASQGTRDEAHRESRARVGTGRRRAWLRRFARRFAQISRCLCGSCCERTRALTRAISRCADSSMQQALDTPPPRARRPEKNLELARTSTRELSIPAYQSTSSRDARRVSN
jgi:hypothetical protein